MTPSRRSFFRLSGSALAAFSTLAPLKQAVSQGGDPTDYRALVCVFLRGGNDSNNMVIPLGSSYDDYYVPARPRIAIPDSDIDALTIANQNDTTVNPTGESWGFHPSFAPAGQTGLKDLFNDGKLAVIANVGTLVEPSTAQELLDRTVAAPIQLASHRDQQLQWQAAVSDRPFATGWGGRITDGDLLGVPRRISLSGEAKFLVGTNAQAALQIGSEVGLNLSAQSNVYMLPMIEALYGLDHADTNQGTIGNLFAETERKQFNRVQEQNAVLGQIYDTFVEPAGWPTFPTTNIGDQLRRAAIFISGAASIDQSRQVYFASHNGFDTHQNQNDFHGDLLQDLNDAMVAFHQALVVLGKADEVTTFTASDFNRTFTNNRDDASSGTDHAWGGHALVMGGAVNGGRFYGRMPNLDLDGPDKSPFGGRASWVPAVSVDEFSATLAKWYGVANEQLHHMFPNLHRFNNQDLGFFV